jgi:hypothetical protein
MCGVWVVSVSLPDATPQLSPESPLLPTNPSSLSGWSFSRGASLVCRPTSPINLPPNPCHTSYPLSTAGQTLGEELAHPQETSRLVATGNTYGISSRLALVGGKCRKGFTTTAQQRQAQSPPWITSVRKGSSSEYQSVVLTQIGTARPRCVSTCNHPLHPRRRSSNGSKEHSTLYDTLLLVRIETAQQRNNPSSDPLSSVHSAVGTMAIPAPVAKDHEIFKLLLCTYQMTFFSGMVDAITWLSTVTATLPTHLTGHSVKIGIYFAGNMIEELGGPMFAMLVSFFAGSLAAGVASRSPESKTLMTMSWCLLVRTTPLLLLCLTLRAMKARLS